jgi:hypothetical protein
MGFQISGTTVIDNSRNINAGVGTFTNLNVTPQPLTFSPSDGSTGQSVQTNISITFSQLIQKGTGNITFRSGSSTGTVLQTVGVASTSVTISGAVVTIDPPSNLPPSTDVHVVIDAGAFTSINFTSPIALIDTYNFTTVPFELTSTTPTNGATNVDIGSNITLTSTGSAPVRGTGTITLRSGSATGTILESFDAATSPRITVSGNNWIVDPTSNFPYTTQLFLVIPNTAIAFYAGLNVAGANTYSFTSRNVAAGDQFGGGTVICVSGGVRWIAAPANTSPFTSWNNVQQAVTNAQGTTGCTGWFVPSAGQLQNPGFVCNTFSPVGTQNMWSSSGNSISGIFVNLGNGISSPFGATHPIGVIAYRCVTY